MNAATLKTHGWIVRALVRMDVLVWLFLVGVDEYLEQCRGFEQVARWLIAILCAPALVFLALTAGIRSVQVLGRVTR